MPAHIFDGYIVHTLAHHPPARLAQVRIQTAARHWCPEKPHHVSTQSLKIRLQCVLNHVGTPCNTHTPYLDGAGVAVGQAWDCLAAHEDELSQVQGPASVCIKGLEQLQDQSMNGKTYKRKRHSGVGTEMRIGSVNHMLQKQQSAHKVCMPMR